jgi:hypothetical protein
MKASRPWFLATFSLALGVAILSPGMRASTAASSDAQLVRLSYVQGDVRFNRGDREYPDLNKSWEQAEVNLPIEQNFALATGTDGRAEIEFESGSIMYIAENSVILFEHLTMKDGAPTTRLELLSGTVTIGLECIPRELFAIDTPIGQLQIKYPESSFIRLDSYLNGMALTPQSETGWDLAVSDGSKLHILRGQTLTYEDGRTKRLTEPSKLANDWDQWADARYQARTIAMQAALKASGLTSPIPGLTDLYENGTFSPCAPYGTCWEPSQQSMDTSHHDEFVRPSLQAAAQTASQTSATPFAPRPVKFRSLLSQCPFPVWFNKSVVATTPQQFDQLTRQAYLSNLQQPWSWPVCHYARWIYRRNGYRVVIRGRRHHHPVRWVKVGKQTGFVPAHPDDKAGKPPVNLKHGFFIAHPRGNNEKIERVDFRPNEQFKSLSSPPKEFRPGAYPELARTEPPEIHGRLMEDAAPGGKFSDVKTRESKITYDYKTGNFVRPGVQSGEHSSRSVVVGGVSSRGSFSGGADRSSGGSRSTSSGGSSEGRSGGGSSYGGSRDGSGTGDRDGSSSGGGGGRPR